MSEARDQFLERTAVAHAKVKAEGAALTAMHKRREAGEVLAGLRSSGFLLPGEEVQLRPATQRWEYDTWFLELHGLKFRVKVDYRNQARQHDIEVAVVRSKKRWWWTETEIVWVSCDHLAWLGRIMEQETMA